MSLTGRLLVAMPTVTERAFRKSVLLVCAHSRAGAMGLLINRPATNMTLRRLLRESGLRPPQVAIGVPIHAGGPADIERSFTLHSSDYDLRSQTIRVTEDVWLTPHRAVLQDLGHGRGPDRSFIAMGYCGWGAGQIEEEIREGSWLTTEAPSDTVFDLPAADRWLACMHYMGIAPSGLSFASGHA
ncbi:YqgE/AlgH family protein [Jannaschia formosa]|uniref:YqgE/AlgH family protein n=1 Tax=Jannaschia formosa TaxID=2259592 RepID=UPI00142F688D|nr:YqgE/AlgH family protein [Jannaschia formosa]